jgi:hypothetical protein
MMEVIIDRAWKRGNYTVGKVIIGGKRFSESMEDKDRGLTQDMSEKEIKDVKVYGETAIPTGVYTVKMTYSQKYKRNMPEVLDVPGFSGIRIHSGNTAKDSLGCILLGRNTKVGMITESRKTCKEFERMLEAAGGECKLTIV